MSTRRAADLPLDDQISLLSGGDFWHTRAVPQADVPSVALADGPHGLRYQKGNTDHLGVAESTPATCFPPAATLASSWDEDLVREVGRAVGDEAAALGVGLVLGPGMNIKRHPLCGRNFEYFSEDPRLTGRLAAAMVDGIQAAGVGACPKHFAVNNQESYRFVVDAIVDQRTMREIYLSAFEHVVTTARPWALMASYNLVNGVPASQHHQLLADVLREQWGFDGVVISDWAATSDRVAAVAAGMDLEMPGNHGMHDRAVKDAVRDGRLPAGQVTDSAQRILDMVARAPRPTDDQQIPVHAHDALARRAAAESTVLLVNDGLLPFGSGLHVAVVGAFATQPRFQGSGSSKVNPTRVTTLIDALIERGVTFTYARGYDPEASVDDAALIAEAVDVARAADVVVVLAGLPGVAESEGFDRDHLDLPAQHNALVTAVAAANRRTVVALSNGSPVLMPWKDDVAAIVESYLGGQASGGALADVLFGDVDPSGRLAETFPAALADVAADPYFPGDPHQVEYREGLMVGYRHTATTSVAPLFAFGHGLSYTTFDWTDAVVDRHDVRAGGDVTVELDVTNTGDRAGADVVQVYLHNRTGHITRPRRELAAFTKVWLEPDETQHVKLTVPGRAFAFWDAGRDGWSIPNGQIDLEVARSSKSAHDILTVEVVGSSDFPRDRTDVPGVAVRDRDFAARLGHPVPLPRPVRPFTRHSTLGEVAQTQVGALLKKAIEASAPVGEGVTDDPTIHMMFKRAMNELPLYAAANLSGGRLPDRTVGVLVALMNLFGSREPR